MDPVPMYYFTAARDQSIGPVSRAELETAMRAPDWQEDTLVWREDWADWKDWRTAAAEIGIAAPLRLVGSSGNVYAPPSARLEQSTAVPGHAETIVPASFVKRFAAWFVDQLVLSLGMMLVIGILAIVMAALLPVAGNSQTVNAVLGFVYLLAVPALYLGYYVYCDTRIAGATLGKRALGIRVTDLDGRRIGMGRSLARTVSSAASYMILYLGFLMALVTRRKQALHDFMAGTLVIEKSPDDAGNSGSTIAIIAVVVAICFGAITIVAILAAIALPAYADYTHRAAVAQAIHETQALQREVLAYAEAHQSCPEQDAAPFGPPRSLAGKHHSAVEIMPDTSVEGTPTCGIRIIMGGRAQNAPEGSLVLRLSPDGRVTCANETLNRRYLPRQCRIDIDGPE